jgi:hypothetical protein
MTTGINLCPSFSSTPNVGGVEQAARSLLLSDVGYRNPWIQSVAGHADDTAIPVDTRNDEI